MVVFDTSILALAFDGHAKPPTDPATGMLLSDCQARIEHLIHALSEAKERVMIPTPVLAEYLVNAGNDRDKRLAELTGSRVFVIASFDIRAAVECAALEDADPPKNRLLPIDETKVKVKFDRQIIAIAIARGASVIYTGDIRLAARARRSQLRTVMTWELNLPQGDPQMKLRYEADDPAGNADPA